MPRFAATYEFPNDPESVYAILTDVECLSDIIPLCKRSRVLSRELTGDREVLLASILLRYRQVEFERSVDLRFTLWQAQRRLQVEDARECFGSGASLLSVCEHGRGRSRVEVESDYRFGHPLLRVLVGRRVMSRACSRIMDRVRQQAESLARL